MHLSTSRSRCTEVRVANVREIAYEMHDCIRQGDAITCSFLLTAEGKDRDARIYSSQTRFIDFDGNE